MRTHEQTFLSHFTSCSPLAPATLAFFQFPKGTTLFTWGPWKVQLCFSFYLKCSSPYRMAHPTPLLTSIHPSGQFLREASLIKIRFSCYNLSYSLLFLNYTNPTCNHFSFRRVITCNDTFMIMYLIGQPTPSPTQSAMEVETYSGH